MDLKRSSKEVKILEHTLREFFLRNDKTCRNVVLSFVITCRPNTSLPSFTTPLYRTKNGSLQFGADTNSCYFRRCMRVVVLCLMIRIHLVYYVLKPQITLKYVSLQHCIPYINLS